MEFLPDEKLNGRDLTGRQSNARLNGHGQSDTLAELQRLAMLYNARGREEHALEIYKLISEIEGKKRYRSSERE